MRFQSLPPHSLEDVGLDLTQLQSLLTAPGAQLPFLQLVAAKRLGVDVGTGGAVFSGSTIAAGAVVSHALGRVPVFGGAFDSSTAGVWFTWSAPTATTVTFNGRYFTGTTGTVPFSWLVIG